MAFNSSKISALQGATGDTGATGASGDTAISGTPVDNQVAVWTDASTIEGTSGLVFDSTGLGIGIAVPTQPLHVYGSGAVALLESSSANAWLQMTGSTGNSWQIGADNNGFQFYSDETAAYRLTILKTGLVGIGRTPTTQKLEVEGGGYFSGSVGLGQSNPTSKLSIDSTTAFNLTAGTSTGQDNILLQNDTNGAGTGNYGPSIGFGNTGTDSNLNRRYAAIASVQTSTDVDQVGLAFITHPGVSSGDALVEAMRITAAGLCGIGTAVPTGNLNISSGARVSPNAPNGNADELVIEGTITGVGMSILNDGDSNSYTGHIVFGRSGNAREGFIQYTHSDDLFQVGTRGTIRTTVDGSGNFGIGVTPTSKLDVLLGDDGVVKYKSAAQTLFEFWKEAATEEARMNIKFNGATKIHLRGNGDSYFNGGNVGIGGAAPSRPLEIQSTNNEPISLYRPSGAVNDLTGINFTFRDSNSAQATYGTIYSSLVANTAGAQSGSLLFFTANAGTNAERMRITSTGLCGIGTAAPDDVLHVATGGIRVDGTPDESSSTNSLGMGVISSVPTIFTLNSADLAFKTAGAERLRIDSSGNVKIATGKLSLNANLAEKTVWCGGYGGGLLMKRSDATSDRYAKLGILDASGGFVSGITVDTAGLVGIGTAVPSCSLEISSTLNSATIPTALSDYTILLDKTNNTTGNYGAAIGCSDGAYIPASILFVDEGSAALAGIAFATGGTTTSERLRITSGGNVGIGVSVPSAKIHAIASASTTALFDQTGTDYILRGQHNASNVFRVDYKGQTYIDTEYANSATSLKVIHGGGSSSYCATFTGGNVGIGVTAPSSMLDVAGTIRSTTNVAPTSGTGCEIVHDGTTGYVQSYDRTAGAYKDLKLNGLNLIFATGSERMRITSGGDCQWYNTSSAVKMTWDASAESLGIGTEAPSDMLELSGASPEIRLTDSDLTSTYSVLSGNGGHVSIQADASNQTGGSRITMEVDGVEQLRIASTGRVTVKKASNAEVTALTDASTVAIDFDDANNFSLLTTSGIGASRELGTPSNITAGQSGCIVITSDDSLRDLTYTSAWHFEGGADPSLTETSGGVDTLAYYCPTASVVQAVLLKDMS